MRVLFFVMIAFALGESGRAESLAPTTSGTFPELIFPNAVIRAYRNDEAVPIIVDPYLRFGPYLPFGTIEPAYEIQIDFDVPVHDVKVWYDVFTFEYSAALLKVVGIDEFGEVVTSALSAPDGSVPIDVPLPKTYDGHNVRKVLIHSTGPSAQLVSIDFETNRLTPGSALVAKNLSAGGFRDAFLMGCRGRTLELKAESFDSAAAVRFSVGPADDFAGDRTKSQEAKVGKLRKFQLDEPRVYRVRLQNVGPTDLSQIVVATGESFDPTYDKTKLVVDAISTSTTADALFGALPDTSIDISVKTIGEFTTPVKLALMQGPTENPEANLSSYLVATDTGFACFGLPIRTGGLLRLQCSNLGDPSNKLQVTVKRTRPLPGIGILEL